MRVLSIASQKGGSGKTTLTGHIAVQAELSGAGPVALIDTDPQASLADWWNERTAQTPVFAQTVVSRLSADLEQLRNMGIKLVVIRSVNMLASGTIVLRQNACSSASMLARVANCNSPIMVVGTP